MYLNALLTATKVSSESPMATKGENAFYSLILLGTRQHAHSQRNIDILPNIHDYRVRTQSTFVKAEQW